MDSLYEIGMLLDFYGELLTEKQKNILELHYNCDLSLGEIAEHMNISRQGVYDNVKKGKDKLYTLEKKLGLVSKFMDIKESLEEIGRIAEEVETADCAYNNIKEKTEKIKKLAGMIISKY